MKGDWVYILDKLAELRVNMLSNMFFYLKV